MREMPDKTSTLTARARIPSADVHVVFSAIQTGFVMIISAPTTKCSANVVVVVVVVMVVVVVVVLAVVLGKGLVVVPTVWNLLTAPNKSDRSCI